MGSLGQNMRSLLQRLHHASPRMMKAFDPSILIQPTQNVDYTMPKNGPRELTGELDAEPTQGFAFDKCVQYRVRKGTVVADDN